MQHVMNDSGKMLYIRWLDLETTMRVGRLNNDSGKRYASQLIGGGASTVSLERLEERVRGQNTIQFLELLP